MIDKVACVLMKPIVEKITVSLVMTAVIFVGLIAMVFLLYDVFGEEEKLIKVVDRFINVEVLTFLAIIYLFIALMLVLLRIWAACVLSI